MDYPTFESMHEELSVAYAELEAQNHSLRDLNQRVELESEKFYKLFYQMPLMIFMVDDHGKIINMNEKALARVVNEREKKVFVSFLSRSSDKSKLFNILGTLKANTTTCIRNALVDFQGVTLTCDIYIFFLMIKSQKMFYLLLVDNTEAIQLAEKIEKSSSQYKYLFDNMFNGMMHHQLVMHSNGVRDTQVLVVNAAFERLTKLSKDAAEGQYLRTLFPGIEDAFIDNTYKCVETQSIVSFTMYISYFGREFSTVLYPINHDKCMGIFEVTNKQLTFETQLKSAMSVLNSTVEGLIVTNADSDIVHVNEAFTRITGYTRDEIIGKKPHILSSDYHDADFYIRLWNNVHKDGRWQGEIWNKRKNNECYPQWSTISALKDDRGAVTNYVCVFSDISSIKKTEKDIFNLAYFDTLTRLPNRMSFNSHIDTLLKNGQHLALLFMDLDGFKNINDTMGHDIGDRVLVCIAVKLRSILRSNDFISRFGGDEFVVILQRDNTTNIEFIVNKIIKEFNTTQVEDLKANLTFSIGVSLYPHHGDTASVLLKNADIAMYEAKKAGKNNYKVFDNDMLNMVRDRARTDLQIRSAITNNEFFLEYQPEYDIATGRVHSYEALARWNSPEHGLLYPGSFIEIAEETNLIVDIGTFVCTDVFKQIHGT
jgi:diguanylate cyclase (GGDEF)-like protein/PAS domain S-box-containing protein